MSSLVFLAYLSTAETYRSSWHKESVGVGSIGFTLIHLLGRYFHGLTERTSVSQHNHTHINTQPDTQTQPPHRKAQVDSTKKKTRPILIK